jgi:hypothetical protein
MSLANECVGIQNQRTGEDVPLLQQVKVGFEGDPFDLLIQIIRLEEGAYQFLVTSISRKTPDVKPAEVLINMSICAMTDVRAASIEEKCYPLPFR